MAKVAPETLRRARALRRRLTRAETLLWSHLRADVGGIRFRRQHPLGPYIADFACLATRLIIEVDGATHGAELERDYDRRREQYFRARGWRVIRIWNGEIYKSIDEVVSFIVEAARNPSFQ